VKLYCFIVFVDCIPFVPFFFFFTKLFGLIRSFDMPADGQHVFALYFMSDVYLGLDQQYELPFTVKS
jgi:hypothetical protein